MNYQKLDHGLLAVLDLVEHDQPLAEFNAYARVMAIGAGANADEPLIAVVFIHGKDDDAFEDAAELGALLGGSPGRIRTATIPLSVLDALSDLKGISAIVAARPLWPQLDRALPLVGVPAFRQKNSVTGAGVVMGIVDSGLDVSHPAFTKRVHCIWDQTLPGPGVREGAYGTELTGAQMFSSHDETGHGTHVAGIAAARDATYGGIAPDATLVIVKTANINARIGDALAYIFRIAEELGMPAVINLSFGAHWDPHDGSDELSTIIARLSGPGRIVCAAAGNQGIQDVHGRHVIAPNSTAEMLFRVPPRTINIVTLNIWYTRGAALEISVQSPNDFYTPWQAQIQADRPQNRYDLPEGRVRVTTAASNVYSADINATVDLTPRKYGEAIASGLWRLRFRNTGAIAATVDAWVIDDGDQDVVFSGSCVDNSMKIGSPGAAPDAITVASYTSKVTWTSTSGTVHSVGLALDDISEFSSVGPLRNGGLKPDLAAPGAVIVSVRSSQAQVDSMLLVRRGWVARSGTSMATPFVAGIVALMLQADTTLTPADIKDRLRAASRIRGQAAGTHDVQWGYGLPTI